MQLYLSPFDSNSRYVLFDTKAMVIGRIDIGHCTYIQ